MNTQDDQAATITVENTSAGAFQSVLRANTLNNNSRRPVLFRGLGQDLSTSGNTRLELVNAPALDDGIIPAARLTGPSGLDLATIIANPAGVAVVALPASAYVPIDLAGVNANVKVTTNTALTTSKSINALLIADGVTVSGNDASLVINSGVLAFAGNGTLSVEQISLGGTSSAISVESGKTATIGSASGPASLGNIYASTTTINKSGEGKLILRGDNQFSTQLEITEGIVNAQRSSALGSPAGATVIRQAAGLEIQQTDFGPVQIGLEAITNQSVGFSPAGKTGSYASAQGGIHNLAGDNAIAGTITINGNAVDLTDVALYDGFPIIATSESFYTVDGASSLTLTGQLTAGSEVVKRGTGTLELAGITQNVNTGTTRVLEGTLRLNKAPGLDMANAPLVIGTDAPGANPAEVDILQNEQIRDAQTVTIYESGKLDLNGKTENFSGTLVMTIGANGAADVNIGSGGYLDVFGDINVFTEGTSNPTGATIAGGTLGLELLGQTGAALQRNWVINDGVAGSGTDLLVTSALVDGSGFRNMGFVKTGFGTLELAGPTSNTYTGTTTINEGTLLLSKDSSAQGVNATAAQAMAGPLTIGDNNVLNGYANSDVVRYTKPNQLPDFTALVTVQSTAVLDLNNNSDAIGVADAQTGLSIQSGATIQTGALGTLSLTGNILGTSGQGVNQFTAFTPPRISGNLNLGSVARFIDTGGDRSELPIEFVIDANISGSGGIQLNNSGTLMLLGNNAGLTGDIVRSNGNFAIGSDTALGTGRLYINGGSLVAFGGKRTLANELFLQGTITFGVGTVSSTGGGGGNDFRFTGPASMYAAATLSIPSASSVEFAAGIGESYTGTGLTKSGFGTLILSGNSPYSTATTINTNGGAIVIRDGGAVRNSTFTVNLNGTLQIDDSGSIQNSDRLGDNATITMSGGQLAYVGKPGSASTESIGTLTITGNTSNEVQTLISQQPGSSGNLRIASLGFSAGSFVNFVGRGTAIDDTSSNKVNLTTAPALDDGIVRLAFLTTDLAGTASDTVDFLGLGTVGSDIANHYLEPFAAATTLAGAGATTNVKLTAASGSFASVASINALLIVGSGLAVTGGTAMTVNSGMLYNAGGANAVNMTAALNLGAAEGVIYTDRGSTLSTNATTIIAGTTQLSKQGPGAYISAAASATGAFASLLQVNEGVYQATGNSAFGTSAGNVTVATGARLELAPGLDIPAETLTLNGTGEGTQAFLPLRILSDATPNNPVQWRGNVVLNSNRTAIDVAAGEELILQGATTNVTSGNGLNKFGSGTLELSGTTGANTFTADNQSSIVWQGTLEMSKAAATAAIRTPGTAVQLIVGDHIGGPNADQLILLSSDQIPDAITFTVNSSGRFDLGTNSETLNAFTLVVGPTASSTVTSTTGVLATTGNITLNVVSGGAPTAATISGNLQLAGAAGARVFTVNDSAAVNDLTLSATLTNLAGVNLQKDGGSRMAISGNSPGFTGNIVANVGETVVTNAGALGDAVGTTSVSSGATLRLETAGASFAEPLTINGIGQFNQGVLRNVAGNNTWTGAVTLAAAAETISVDVGTNLDINAAITGGAAAGSDSVIKLMDGTLRFSGSASNTYTGTTRVSQGTLELNKTGVVAVAGRIEAGNNAGGPDSDVVSFLQPNQINSAPGSVAQLIAETSGLFDLNGNNQNISTAVLNNAIFTRQGTAMSGHFDLDGATITLSMTGANGIGANPTTGTFTINSPGGLFEDGTITANSANAFIIDVSDVAALNDLRISTTLVNGANTLNKITAGTLLLSTDNSASYTGGMSVTAGTLAIGNNNALGTGALTVAGAASLRADGAPRTIANPITLNSTLTVIGNQNLTLSGKVTATASRTLATTVSENAVVNFAGGIDLNNSATAGQSLTFNVNTFNTTTTASGVVEDTGAAAGLSKGGTGRLVLSNVNTFDGATTVAAGILQITNSAALGTITTTEQQFATTSSGGGSFVITFNNQQTVPLAYSGTVPPTALAVQNAINGLPALNGVGSPVTVTSSNPAGPTTTYTLTFGGPLAGFNQTLVSVAVSAPVTLSTAATTTITGGGGTTVNANAALEVLGSGLSINEGLTLNGLGFNGLTTGALRMLDLTPGISETNIWTGSMILGTTPVFAVDGGGANPDTLTLGGTGFLTLAGSLTKAGPGTLELAGTSNNSYTGGTIINDGVLLLNKQDSAGRFFQPNATGTGNITVGNEGGSDNADILRYAATAGTDQIFGLSNVTVTSSGVLDLATGSASDFINALTLETGRAISGDVQTGAGTLTVNGDITVNTFGPTDGTAPAATISGKLNMTGATVNSNSLGQFNQTQQFIINETIIPSPNDDLIVSAVIGELQASGGFVSGLREGRIAGFNNTATANPANLFQVYPRMGEVQSSGTGNPWNTAETWVYTGQFFDADGIVSFGSAMDDAVWLNIDGTVVMTNSANGTVTTGLLTLGAGVGGGWHTIEIRVSNNGGTGGATARDGFSATFGFGIAPNGSAATGTGATVGGSFAMPIDNGTMNLFRNAAAPIPYNLTKSGLGTLRLTGNNTFTGTTSVNTATVVDTVTNAVRVGGTLSVSGGGDIAQSSGITVNAGTTLTLDATTANPADAAGFLGNAAGLTVAGGSVNLIGNAAGTTELMGGLTINAGNNAGTDSSISINSAAGGVTELQAASLTRGVGGAAHLTGVGADLDDTTNSRLQITGGTNPFVNGVLPWATISGPAGFDLVTDGDGNSATAPFYLSRVTAYNTSVNSGGIVRVTGGTDTLTANRTVDALLIEGGATINGPFTLQVGAGAAAGQQGLVVSRNGTNTIAAGATLTFDGGANTREALVLVQDGRLTAAATVDASNANALRKERSGELALAGNDDTGVATGQLASNLVINAGTLLAQANNALGTVGATVTVNNFGSLALDGALSINKTGALTLNGFGLPNNAVLDATNPAFGSLRATGGNTTYGSAGAAPITINNTPVATAAVNVAGANVLTLGATVSYTGNTIKVGSGELILQGTASNSTGTGTFAANQGAITLNKTGTNIAINGALTIDDLTNFDPAGGSTVQYAAASASTNALAGAATVNYKSTLNLNGKTDTVNPLVLQGGTITVGAGTLQADGSVTITGGSISSTGAGLLRMNSSLTYNSGLAQPGTMATIDGTVNLNAGVRTFTVNDGPDLYDLIVNAQVTGATASGLSKAGNGVLQLTNAANNYPGTNEVQTVTFTGSPTGGTFTLSFNGATTANITYDTTFANLVANVTPLLAALPTIGSAANFTLGGTSTAMTVTFTGALAGADVTTLVATNINLTGGIAPNVSAAQTTAGVFANTLSAGVLAVGANTALGAGGLNWTGGTIWADGGDRVLANSPTIGGTVTLGGRRDYGGTFDLAFSTLGDLTANVTLNVDDPDTLATLSGALGENAAGRTLTKQNFGKLILGGDNRYTGNTSVSNGILNIQHSNALGVGGTTGSGVTVTVVNLAALELQGGVNVQDKTLQLQVPNNVLEFAGGYLFGRTGSLRNISGNNTWSGTVDIRNVSDTSLRAMYVGVDSGTLAINGTVTGTGNGADELLGHQLVKVGSGALTFAGGPRNLLQGEHRLVEGTLNLNKIAGSTSVIGPLLVGDNGGTDTVAIQSPEQIRSDVNAVSVTIQSSGVLRTEATVVSTTANETQAIVFPAILTAGTFTINFGGTDTVTVPFDATPSRVQSLINALNGGTGPTATGLVQVGGTARRRYEIAFTSTTTDVVPVVVDPTALTPNTAPSITELQKGGTTILPGQTIGNAAVAQLQMFVGPTSGAVIDIAANTFIAIGNDTTAGNQPAINVRPGLNAAVGARIQGAGTFGLVGANQAGIVRTINVNDSPATNELEIAAVVADRPAGGSGAGASGLTKGGQAAGRLLLSSGNTYTGNTSVTAGALAISNGTALGPASSGTTAVSSGAALELSGGITVSEILSSVAGTGILNGPIQANQTAIIGTGAIRSSGNNFLLNNITLATATVEIAVDNGADSLVLFRDSTNTHNASTLTGAITLIKEGPGTLEMAGTAANTYGGNTFINEGILLLNKQGAVAAIDTGELFIGDNVGVNDSDIVRYAPTAGTNQLGDQLVRIARTGVLDLNGISDANQANIVIDNGPTFSGDITLGAAVFSIRVTADPTVFTVGQGGTTSLSVPVTITSAGAGGLSGTAGTINFETGDTAAPIELTVNKIIGTSAFNKRIVGQRRGTMQLLGTNTYSGTTNIEADAGTLLVDGSIAAGAVTVNPNSTLGGSGTIGGAVTLAAFSGNLSVGGILNPGPALNPTTPLLNTGILTINNAITFNQRSLLSVDINGPTAGAGPAGYDQVVTSTTGAVTINTTAGQEALVGGTRNPAFSPATGAEFLVLSRPVGASVISGQFRSLAPVPAPGVPPAQVTVGDKLFGTSYNDIPDVAASTPANGQNDFVLLSAVANRVWDGVVDGGPLTTNDNWTNPQNWVGDVAPVEGDNLIFNDVGVGNRPNPSNDFAADTNFGLVTIANTTGTYTLGGNRVEFLAASPNGIADSSTQSNTVNFPILTGTTTQGISNTSGGTLSLNGAISLGAGGDLSITGGSNIAFGAAATINGAQSLSINSSGGDVSFGGAVGGGLTTVSVTAVDDLTFASSLAATGSITQSAGTGATTFAGTVNGAAINVTTASIALSTANSDLTAGGGNPISLTASQGLSLAASASLTTTNTAIGLVARDMTINAAASIAAGAGTVSLRPFTAGHGIDLGALADPVNTTLELSDPELDTISAAAINLGDANTAPVTVTAAINRAAATNLFVTGGSIAFSGGSLDASGGDVTLSTTGAVSADAAGTDVTANVLSITAGVAGIGSGANPLRTAVATLVTDTNDVADGTQFLLEADSLTIGAADLDAGVATITLSGGTFLTTATGSILSNTVVGSGATLGGSGTVTGTVQVNSGGTVNPGASPGILSVGSVTFVSGATYAVEINGLIPGTQHDRLDVSGTVSLGNAMLALNGTYFAPSNVLQSITIIDNDGSLDPVTGIFNGLPEGSPIASPGGGFLFITYQGGDGNDVVLNSQPIVNGTSGADTLIFRQVSGSPNNFEFSLNGGPFINVGMVTTFTFNGLGGDDVLIDHFVNGDAIPGTGLPGEGLFYNGNTHDIPLTSGAHPTNGDILRVIGTLAENATYMPDGTVSAADNDGTISVVSSGVIAFTGLEPVDLVSLAVANVFFPNAADNISLVNGITFGGGGLPALIVSGTSGGVGFETVALRDNGQVNIDTVAGGSDGADSVTITSANNAHLNASLTINTGSGADTIDIDGPLVFSSTVNLNSQQINFNLAAVVTAADVELHAGTGSITDGDAGPDVVATNLTATATTGINLDTTVATIFNANNSGAGPISIDESDGVTLTSVTNSNGPIAINAGGLVTATLVQVTTDAEANDITLNTTSGNIAVGAITAGAGAAADVFLTASAGAITDANGAANNVTAQDLTATSATGIDLDTAIVNLDADVTAAGAITIDEANALTLTDVDTANGPITITAAGTLNAVDVVSSTDNDANDIDLTTTSGNLAVTVVTAGAGAAADAFLTASAGAITDANGAANNVTADVLTANSATGINLDTMVATIVSANTTSAGTIDIDEADAITLTSVVTASGDIFIDAGNSITSVTVTAGGLGGDVLLTTAAGDITFTGTMTASGDIVKLIAAGSILDANPATEIVAASASLQAGGSIGTAAPAGAIDTQVTNLAAATGPGGIFLANTGALTITSVTFLGTVTGVTGSGQAQIRAASPLTVAANVIMGGNVLLTAADASDFPALADDLTVNAGVVVQSTGGSVTLNAGDDASLGAGALLAAATTLTINIDFGNAEDGGDGAGGAGGATLLIDSTADIDAVSATFNGESDNDTFTFRPDDDATSNFPASPLTDTPIFVNGLAPTTFPGDVLNLDISGLTNPTLTIGGGPNDGAWSFGNAASVTYTSIEDVNVTPAATCYGLILDMNLGLGAASPTDIITLSVNAPNLEIRVSGVNGASPIFAGDQAQINHLTVLGSSDADTLVLQETASGLPAFCEPAEGPLGGHTSPTFTTLTGYNQAGGVPVDLHFNGNAGADALAVNLISSHAVVYTSDALDTSKSGNVGIGTGGAYPAFGARQFGLSFESLAPLTISGAGGTLTADASSSPDGDVTSLTIADAAAAGDGISSLTPNGSSATFEPVTFSGFTGLVVRSGGGADTLDLVSLDSAAVLTNITLDADNLTNTDASADTVRAQSTGGVAATVRLLAGAASDLFQVLQLPAGTIDGLAGQVLVSPIAGPFIDEGVGTDSLVVSDVGDASPDNVTITETTVEGLTGFAGAPDIDYRAIDDLNVTGTAGVNVFDILLNPGSDLDFVTVNGNAGNDTFLLDLNTGEDQTNSVAGLVRVTLNGDAGGDTFGQTPDNAPHQGTGAPALPAPPAALPAPVFTPLPFPGVNRGKIRPSQTTNVVINGGLDNHPSGSASPAGNATAGNVYGANYDLLNLDMTDTRPLAQSDDSFVVVSTVSGSANLSDPDPGESFVTVNFGTVEAINLCDQGKLTRTAMGDLYVRTTDYADVVQFSLTSPAGVYRTRINSTFYNLAATTRMIVYGRGGNDTIQQTNVTLPLEAYGEDGDDYISGYYGNDLLVGGPGNDRLLGSNGNNELWGDNLGEQSLNVGGNDQLSGGAGSDLGYGGGGIDIINLAGGNDYAFGGWGSDSIDGGDGDDRLYGGEGDDTISGYLGNDLLAGNGGNDKLYGQDGNDVVIGGLGADLLAGDNGDDLLLNGTATYDPVGAPPPGTDSSTSANDTNDAAMLLLLNDWVTNKPALLGSLLTPDDGSPDTLGGGAGNDRVRQGAGDTGDWEGLLP